MKNLSSILLSFFFVPMLVAQPTINWSRTMGGADEEGARSVKRVPTGGYIVTGFAESVEGDVSGNHGSYDFWVIKLTETGDTEWKKCLGGSQFDLGHSVDLTHDGGYIILGVTRSKDGDVSGHHGSEDIWVLKINAQGDIEWQKAYGGSNIDRGASIQQTSDGAYIIMGATMSSNGDVSGSHPDSDVWSPICLGVRSCLKTSRTAQA